jgi:tetratricopeptide (TPR) repeat protein
MRVTSAWLLLASGLALYGQSLDDGVQAFHEGRYADAVKLLEAFQNDARGAAFYGMSLAGAGRCTEAEPVLSAAVQARNEVGRLAGLALTQCLVARKDYAGAAQVLARLNPKDADVLYETARLHMRAWDEAIAEMFRSTPSSFRVNQLSGEVFETQGRYGEAAAEYRKAIQKSPATLNLHYRLGRAVLLESHEPSALALARKEFEAELKLNPRDAAAEYQVGQILIALQHSADADGHFAKAAELNPSFAEAYVARAKVLLESKRYADAAPLLEKAIQVQPALEAAHYSLMVAYRSLGRTADALREKAELDKLQKPPEGEFTEFLKKLKQ